MRKNYFAKKFVAYSMAFAVAFSTLTVSPVFVKEAKAAPTCMGNIATTKKPKVAAITDLKTLKSNTTVYDGAVFLSTVNTERFPSSSLAARIIPSDTNPHNLAGFKLVITATFFPTISSGV